MIDLFKRVIWYYNRSLDFEAWVMRKIQLVDIHCVIHSIQLL
jgi:hypothetical protein